MRTSSLSSIECQGYLHYWRVLSLESWPLDVKFMSIVKAMGTAAARYDPDNFDLATVSYSLRGGERADPSHQLQRRDRQAEKSDNHSRFASIQYISALGKDPEIMI